MRLNWPVTANEYLPLAEAFCELFGGRDEVIPRYWERRNEQGEIERKGFAPWKARNGDFNAETQASPEQWLYERANPITRAPEWLLVWRRIPKRMIWHLRGAERLGVYVLRPDNTCSFIAADFDDHDGTLNPAGVWAEAKGFADTCEVHEWQCHIERSNSGNGYHVWIFFDKPVPAAKARGIGRWLLEESQVIESDTDFSTFDRFFPAQSQLSGNGLGNLIALPFAGPTKIEEGKTVFLDSDTGEPIADQRVHLHEMLKSGRNPAAQVDAFMEEEGIEPEECIPTEQTVDRTKMKLGTKEELKHVVRHCLFMHWAATPENQNQVSEPQWYAMISNACRFDNDDWIHSASDSYSGYRASETDAKIAQARLSSGPMSCSSIQGLGYQCPEGGCILPGNRPTKAPAGLAVWANNSSRPSANIARQSPPPQQQPPRQPPRQPPQQRGNLDMDDVGGGSGEPEASPPGDGYDVKWANDVSNHPDTGMPWPQIFPPFNVVNDGVVDHKNNFLTLRPAWVSALTMDTENANGDLSYMQFGARINFFDFNWKHRTMAVPLATCHEHGGMLGKAFSQMGLPIVPGKEKMFARYLISEASFCPNRVRSTNRLGWLASSKGTPVYVLPGSRILGTPDVEVAFQPDNPTAKLNTLKANGSLASWQQHVANPCRGNPMLMFALLCGLSGPMLKLCDAENGGVHIYGTTTGGKTTAAQVAASVWGCGADPQQGAELTSINKWNSTANALEALAEVHNDGLLVLDEIAEMDPHDLLKVLYQLPGGTSKNRMDINGGLRSGKSWRILIFSTGESSIKQAVVPTGAKLRGGQLLRIIDIPVDNDSAGERGIIQQTGGKTPAEFADDLKRSCARHYGLAGPTFASYLVNECVTKRWESYSGELQNAIKATTDALADDIKQNLPPEARRVLKRFALIYLSGLLSTRQPGMAGIIDWSPDEIWEAVVQVRDQWLSDLGEERSEAEKAVVHLRGFLLANQGRFIPFDVEGRETRDALGIALDDYLLVYTEQLAHCCGEYDQRTVLRALEGRKLLWSEKGRKTKKAPRNVKTLKDRRPSMYWISRDIFGAKGEQPDDDESAELAKPKDPWVVSND